MGSPSLSPTYIAQLTSTGASVPACLVVTEFENETLYLFTGTGQITPAGPAYNPLSPFAPYYGVTFTGLGQLGKISAIPQTTRIAAQNITLSLSGIPATLVSEVIAQVRLTGTATVFLAFLNPSTGAVIADPRQIFAGSLDVPTLDDSGETSTLQITCENPLLLLNQAPNRQFDDMDQQIYFPGDLGLSFVNALGNTPLFWPSPTANASVWQVDLILSPQGQDVAVGGTFVMSATANYSDTSSFTRPALSGSGGIWYGGLVSSDPEIATVDFSTGVVTGRKPGVCLIIARQLQFTSGGPYGELRVATTVIVHS